MTWHVAGPRIFNFRSVLFETVIFVLVSLEGTVLVYYFSSTNLVYNG